MNKMITALLICILLCQVAIIVLLLRERTAAARLIDDLLRRRESIEAAIKEQYASSQSMRAPAVQSEDVRVEVLPDGSVRVDGQWMIRNQFDTFVAKKPWSAEKVIHIIAAPSTPSQSSLEIFNAIRGQGFEKVTVETK